MADPNDDRPRLTDRVEAEHLVGRLTAVAESDFRPATRPAFRRTAVLAEPAKVVADELGVKVNAVMIARSRVVHRLWRLAARALSATAP